MLLVLATTTGIAHADAVTTEAGQSVMARIVAIVGLTATLIIGVNSSRNSRRIRHYARTGELPHEIAFTFGTE